MDQPVYKNMTGKAMTSKGLEYLKTPDGFKGWFKDGELHREGGPAYKEANGRECWYKEKKRHRLDGPAIKTLDGSLEYYLEGVQITKEDFDYAWKCPMGELPLLINKDTALIAKWRLEHGE